MTSYLERLKAIIHEKDPREEPPKPPKPGSGGFGGDPGGHISDNSLPADTATGVQRLQRMQPVGGVPRDTWRAYVADALWLVESGAAADALGQGWTAVDLFGISADGDWQCLAAWINGRRDDHGRACLLLTEIRGDRSLPYAVHVRDGRHSWHYRQPAPADAVLPWTM